MITQGLEVRYRALSQPGRIGKLALPHRVLMGSMHMGLERQPDKLQQLCDFYRERAEGMAALIITGGAVVTQAGGGDMYVLTEKADVEALAQLPKAVHSVGGKIALQLFHSGRYAFSEEIGMQALAPSPIASRLTREVPREMTVEDIEETIRHFANAARTAQDIGFDAIEIMGSEGYLLNQFLSPLTNQRDDQYGGSLEGRMRMSLDVVAAIRKAVGWDYPIIFRMSGLDCMPGSTTPKETIVFAQALEAAGVDALNVGIGWHESRVPTVQQIVPRGGFAAVAGAIRSQVGIPVIGANRVNVPEVANALIADGYLDFVAPARPWLADSQFAKKALEGDRSGLNVCIACNQSCLDHTLVRPHMPVSCLVNPRAGQESQWPRIEALVKRRVAVVGAGPAGLQAAVTAAERGHEVVLFERQAEIGGQFRMAGRIPGKDEFYETIRYFREMLERLSVTVKMQTEPTVDELCSFDHVILAQGVVPRIPDIPGTDLPHVVTYAAVLNGEVQVGRRIAIIGAGGIGCDVATFLAEGRHVPADVEAFFELQSLPTPPELPREITVLARSERYGHGIGRSTRWVVKQEMSRLGVRVITNVEFREITPDGVVGSSSDGALFVPADQVILCAGQESQETLAEALADKVSVQVVGGARDSRGINAARAIREALEAAYRIS
ncbi:NADPH-dependent 2,4-dienoyl-CoA reductase [Alicyclobacillus acidoterrestris]|uniref:FAD-dependent oxidoreductase n=1 Tax=Alicyclobacillus suci TaxID=2816080 RepID=UPI0011930BA0|nr:FAD-dependent oxidoreductase [Alicyclobacillus suci]GEO26026.1 NADPH-dependent 2,4-dienoyl-CoA reductase [Alicyclobacillus acidoterrestris]